MKPPYHADHVGSLLRPKALIDAHVAHARGQMPLEHLREIEDRAIREAVAIQRDAGIDVLSDGEYRRGGWVGDFMDVVDGYVPGDPPVRLQWHPNPAAPRAQVEQLPIGRVIGGKLKPRMRLTAHEAGFLKRAAGGAPFKVTMPAPSYLTTRGYKPGVTDRAYASRAEVLRDVTAIVRAEIRTLIDEGVPYIQLDNPHYPDYLMESVQAQWRALGVDPDRALDEDIAGDNSCLEGLERAGVTIAMHFCRGNGGMHGWHSEGSYEPIAERAFGGLKVDRFLLEYDSERAGGFEPLRFVPKDKRVALGLVTTKAGSMESKETLLSRIEAASKYLPIENLALSPQCGFASVLMGNAITPDEQRRKLELVVSTARRVWG